MQNSQQRCISAAVALGTGLAGPNVPPLVGLATGLSTGTVRPAAVMFVVGLVLAIWGGVIDRSLGARVIRRSVLVGLLTTTGFCVFAAVVNAWYPGRGAYVVEFVVLTFVFLVASALVAPRRKTR